MCLTVNLTDTLWWIQNKKPRIVKCYKKVRYAYNLKSKKLTLKSNIYKHIWTIGCNKSNSNRDIYDVLAYNKETIENGIHVYINKPPFLSTYDRCKGDMCGTTIIPLYCKLEHLLGVNQARGCAAFTQVTFRKRDYDNTIRKIKHHVTKINKNTN